jgi:hypothetical protein
VPQYSYDWVIYVLGALLSLAVAYVIFKLHYTYGQAPHRIIKMLAGCWRFPLGSGCPPLASWV